MRLANTILAGVCLLVTVHPLETPASPRPARYVVSTAKLTQELQIAPRGKKTIAFKLDITGSCRKTRAGVAVLKDGDPEIDEDETGLAIPMNEFVYQHKKGCYLAIRVEMDRGSRRARIEQDDCWPCTPVDELMFLAE